MSQGMYAYGIDDMPVADLGAVQLDAVAGKEAFEPEVGHYRGDQRSACEASAPRQPGRDQRHQLVAVENDAALVGDDQPVGVAIERDTDIRPPRQHFLAHLLADFRGPFAHLVVEHAEVVVGVGGFVVPWPS